MSGAGASAIDRLRFENIAISVSDLDRAVAWYREVLGFRDVRSGEFANVGARFAFLEGKGMSIELISTGKAQRPATLVEPPHHLASVGYKAIVLRTDDLAQVTQELEHAGVPIVWKLQPLTDDIAATLIRDLDGNFINIFGLNHKGGASA
ncbi:MAG: VOC family protein [Delftia acidovorans]|uniref:VOC family protein n=1 Tax=Cupriavidus pauculus TaxID=82633 RepID=UPI000DB283DD|nr:VOC family protein [Cupriavidus pauculus]PZP56773.1 MAG: VOC family protein [Delftia acidovorans]